MDAFEEIKKECRPYPKRGENDNDMQVEEMKNSKNNIIYDDDIDIWQECDEKDIFKKLYNDNWVDNTKKLEKWNELKDEITKCYEDIKKSIRVTGESYPLSN